MNKPLNPFDDEKEDYFSAQRMVGMLLGVLAMLAVIILVMLAYWKEASAQEINMQAIAKIESNNNPLAYNKYSHARGMYQVTPICLKDYNIQNKANLGVNDLFRQSTCHTVARWYFVARIPQLLRNKGIPATVDNIIWTYNAGIGNVAKGIMPKDTKNYIKKYHKLTDNHA